MSAMYGKNSISRARVFEWNKRFREGQVSLKDSSRPGQAHLVIATVDAAVRNDRRRTVDDIRLMMGISHGTAHAILTEPLKYRKICAQWVPRSFWRRGRTECRQH
ncbi:Protein GVQW3 like protein [Argiope bruennichi]|uniref:Protein GVQW3 like protein n=1 Tax=Argiope bruennichi TaxID=94029 RepID=A0A8T0FQ11_ARGBR|nr:Protein GVQW3 like protein [Argiope bruennichi]